MEYPEVDAVVIAGRCANGGDLFGMRLERTLANTDLWIVTWSFPLDAESLGPDGDVSDSARGSFDIQEGRVACCRCESRSFFQCNICTKITCWGEEVRYVTCSWCGNSGTLDGRITEMQGTSDHGF